MESNTDYSILANVTHDDLEQFVEQGRRFEVLDYESQDRVWIRAE